MQQLEPRDDSNDPITFREQKFITLVVLEGLSYRQALMRLGFSESIAEHPETYGFLRPVIRTEMERIRREAVELARERGLIDATEILEVLSDGIRFDRRSVRNNDGSFKPRDEWPEVAGKLLEQDECEEEVESVRSHDGVDTEGRGGWEAGTKVRKSKLRFTSTAKLMELAMKHKAVNALAAENHQHLHVVLEAVEAKLLAARAKAAEMGKPLLPEDR